MEENAQRNDDAENARVDQDIDSLFRVLIYVVQTCDRGNESLTRAISHFQRDLLSLRQEDTSKEEQLEREINKFQVCLARLQDEGYIRGRRCKQQIEVLQNALKRVSSRFHSVRTDRDIISKRQAFEVERGKYEIVKDLLEAPSKEHCIQSWIYGLRYKNRINDLQTDIETAGIENAEMAEIENAETAVIESTETVENGNAKKLIASDFDKGIEACDTLRGLALEIAVNKQMDRARTPILIIVAVIVVPVMCVTFFMYGEFESTMVTIAKLVTAFMTAIVGVVTFIFDLEKDVLSFLPKKQKKSIQSSSKYHSHLLTKNLIKAISVIILLAAAILALA